VLGMLTLRECLTILEFKCGGFLFYEDTLSERGGLPIPDSICIILSLEVS